MGGWPKLPGAQGNVPGPDGWGGGIEGGGLGPVRKSYSGIAAINKSVRETKNVLEFRLER